MPNPTLVAPGWPRMIVPRNHQGRAPRPISIHGIARFAFWAIFLLNLTNAMWLLVTYLRGIYGDEFELAIYPLSVAIATALVLVFSKGRHYSPILLAGWGFWLVFFLGGFLGTEQLTLKYFRHTVEVTLKPWITLVGLPWLALRAISADKLPRLIRAAVLVSSVGAVLAFVQVFIPGFMQELNVDAGRGSGFWVNPNSGGTMCGLALFLSLVHPFRWRWLNWTMRLLLIVGVAVSFSRAAMLALLVGWVVYGITAGRFRSLFASMLAFALFLISMFVVLDVIDAVSPHQAKRLNYVRSFLEGDWSSDEADNRTAIWRAAFQAIVEKDGLIFGLGHGSMSVVADGLSPHNAYIHILGNSGIIALFGLLMWLFVLAQQAWKCRRRETRAALLSVVTMIALVLMFDSSFLGPPPTGVIVACFALAVCYGRAPSPSPFPSQSLTVATQAWSRRQLSGLSSPR
ncbi:MAG: O-antigen ligase family protein [Pirellulales bacterium]